MLWSDIRPGDVVFTRSGPWLVTSIVSEGVFGFLLLDSGKIGNFPIKSQTIVQSPIMRETTLLNHHAEVLW